MSKRNYGRSARGVALEVLCRVDEDTAYSGSVLDSILDKVGLVSQDRALATRLVYGTLQKRIFLDHQIETLGGRKISKLDVPVANALRLGAYQIYFCDKIPRSAAVNEAVNAVKRCGFTSAAGLVNAILRKLDPQKPCYPAQENGRIAVKYSLPLWLVEHLKRSYPDEPVEEMAAALDEEPVTYIRVNTTLTDADTLTALLAQEGIEAEKTELFGALAVKRVHSLKNSRAFKDGLFHVQDLASQLCAAALDPKKGDRILDICAAPGGKTFTVAQLANGECSVTACDIHENRVELIKQGARRLRLDCVTPVTADGRIYNGELGVFDKVLCDAPCSGLGVIRRKPEIRFKPQSELEKYGDLQTEILNNASRYVAPGGRLIYSTCTLDPEENEKVVASFLASHSDFSSASLFESGETARTFFPHKDNTDGFFAAAFVKKGE